MWSYLQILWVRIDHLLGGTIEPTAEGMQPHFHLILILRNESLRLDHLQVGVKLNICLWLGGRVKNPGECNPPDISASMSPANQRPILPERVQL